MNTILSYVFVYLYSLASLGVFFSSLRAIAEHQVNNITTNIFMVMQS